jgi:hypothetical protein
MGKRQGEDRASRKVHIRVWVRVETIYRHMDGQEGAQFPSSAGKEQAE